ncbi:MAG: c-type cytochrome [Burkholderiales bacterium]
MKNHRLVLWTLLTAAGLLASASLWLWLHNFNDGVVLSAGEQDSALLRSPAQIQRGAYLAQAGNCMACHTQRGGPPYAGGRGIETPFGTVFSSNLTPDSAAGLGNWTPGHFWRAMHHGRSQNGRLLTPVFPYTSYTQITRADSDALFAYLHSLPPVAQANLPHSLRWPFGTQAALAVWRSLYFKPAEFAPAPTQSAEWNRGAYLVQGLGHCSACHAARDALGGSDPLGLAGGLIPRQNWYAPSLLSSTEAGVADWPLADIAALLKTGTSPRGQANGPMANVVLHSTQHLHDADLLAMARYLKALPPESARAASAGQTTQAATRASTGSPRGAALYEQHCQQCHGGAGQGIAGAYPALAGNRAVLLPVTANLVQSVLYGGYGPATAGNPRPYGMPPYVLVLNDRDLAAVLTHLRSAWGNTAPAVTELEVAQQRQP